MDLQKDEGNMSGLGLLSNISLLLQAFRSPSFLFPRAVTFTELISSLSILNFKIDELYMNLALRYSF